jgi:hypothetical protein
VLIPNNGFDGENIPFICLLVMLGLFPSGFKINLGLWSGFLHDDFMFNLIPLSFGFFSYHNWNKFGSWIKTTTKDIISSDAPLGLSSGIKKFKNLLIFKVAIECKPKAHNSEWKMWAHFEYPNIKIFPMVLRAQFG